MIKILAIDDSSDNLEVVKALLFDAFPTAKLYTAQKGKEGIALAKKEVPDVILLDLVMPEMDGFEVCKALKNNAKLKHIPVIILTAAKVDRLSRIRALDEGADAFLVKPIEEAELRAQITAMLRIKESESRNRTEAQRLGDLVNERTKVLESELLERKKIEENLKQVLTKLETSKIASLNLLEDLKMEIDSKRKTEASLRENEHKLTEAQRIAKLGSWSWDKKSNTFLWSDQMYLMLKWPKAKKIPDFLNPTGIFTTESLKRIITLNHKVLEGGKSYHDDFEVIRDDGRHIWVTIFVEASFDENGLISGIQGTLHDITDRKLIEQSLQKSEKRYRSLFENMLNGFAYCKMIFENNEPVDFVYLLVNKSFEKLTGLKSVTGKNVTEVIPGIRETNPELFELYARVSLSGNPEFIETYLPTLNSWLAITAYSPANEYFIAVFNVITDQKKNEEALKKSEIKYRQLFDKMIDGFGFHQMIYDENGNGIDYRILEINKAFSDITGFLPENIIGKTFKELRPDADKSWIERYSKVAKEEVPIRFENYVPAFDKFFEVVAYSPEKNYFATIFKDISKQKEINEEAEIRNIVNEIFATASGNELYTEMLNYILKESESSFGMLGYYNEEGNFVAAAYTPEVFIPHNSPQTEPYILEKDKFKGIWVSAVNHKTIQVKNSGPFNTGKGYQSITNTIVVPLVFNEQVISVCQLGNKPGDYSPWDLKKLDMMARYVAPLLWGRLESDRQEHKRILAERELSKLTDHIQLMREDEKKNIARDIHDDLGQKLAALKMDLFWLSSNFKEESPIKDRIGEMQFIINESVESIHRIIKDLRPPVLDDLGLFEAIEWIANDVNKRSDLTIEISLNCNEPALHSEVQLSIFRVIQEALTNIVRHSYAKKASLVINRSAQGLVVKIQDNGIGIPANRINNIESYGLSGMKERIASQGGQISINSKIGKGSTIEFTIPLPKSE